jgi:hypothetical protein
MAPIVPLRVKVEEHASGVDGVRNRAMLAPDTVPPAVPLAKSGEAGAAIENVPVTPTPVCMSTTVAVPVPPSSAVTDPIHVPFKGG